MKEKVKMTTNQALSKELGKPMVQGVVLEDGMRHVVVCDFSDGKMNVVSKKPEGDPSVWDKDIFLVT